MIRQDVSVGIKIISIFYMLGALFSALFATLIIVLLAIKELSLDEFGDKSHQLAFLIIAFFVLAIFEFVVGKALWKGKFWARITAMFLSGIIVLSSFIGLILEVEVLLSIILLLTHGAILTYFFYDLYFS